MNFEYYEKWTFEQIEFVKKNYKKFSQIIKKKSNEIETKTTIRMNQIDVSIETFLNAFVLLFFDSNNRFKNQIFIESTTNLKTNSKHTIKRNIEQSFDNVSSIDDLIVQSSK